MPGSPVSIQADIVVIDLATGLETVISRPALFGGVPLDADEIEPAWSPDGGRIAFAGVGSEKYLDGITGAPVDGAQWEIVTVNPDGSDEQVVSAGAPRTDRAQYLEEDRSPAWSPDGTKIVFMSQAQIPACCGPWQIWAVNRDGTGATNLTNDPAVNDLYPSWPPDGTQIIFSRSSSLGFDLYTMPGRAICRPSRSGAARRAPGGRGPRTQPCSGYGRRQEMPASTRLSV
jgi:Tol biopolymer transport system component